MTTDSVKSSAAHHDSCCIFSGFSRLSVLAFRLVLDFADQPRPSLSTLRGVWGKVLHRQAPDAYARVFDGGERNPRSCYVLRSGLAEHVPFVDVFLVGEAIEYESTVIEAWYSTAEEGVGHDRAGFRIQHLLGLSAQRKSQGQVKPWTLADVIQHATLLAHEPARLVFPSPLRLLRRLAGRDHSTLIEQPTLPDLVVAASRRLEGLLGVREQWEWEEARESWLVWSRKITTGRWEGEKARFRRYSGRQKREVMMKGVQGELLLPEGLGGLRDLLLAVAPIHLGKGTSMGMGEMVIERVVAG